MIHNAFSRHYVPEIKLQSNSRDIQLLNSTKANREKMVLAEKYTGIHIPTQAASDESRRKAGRHLRG